MTRARHRGRYEPIPFTTRGGLRILHIPNRQWVWIESLGQAIFTHSTVIIEPDGRARQYPSLWRSRRP